MSNDVLKYRVLVVDDEVKILKAMQRVLKDRYEVLVASSAHEALSILDADRVDVIIADQRMPEMTGVELFEIVRERYPYIIRVLLTGYTDLDAIIDSINKGSVFRYLQKPTPPEMLVETITTALKEQGKGLLMYSSLEADILIGLLESFNNRYGNAAGLITQELLNEIIKDRLEAFTTLYGRGKNFEEFAKIFIGDYLPSINMKVVSVTRTEKAVELQLAPLTYMIRRSKSTLFMKAFSLIIQSVAAQLCPIPVNVTTVTGEDAFWVQIIEPMNNKHRIVETLRFIVAKKGSLTEMDAISFYPGLYSDACSYFHTWNSALMAIES